MQKVPRRPDRDGAAEHSDSDPLGPEERAPLRATTYGTGQLIRHATERGARKILVGLGGSATTDGGIGMAAALGYEFLTSDATSITGFGNCLIVRTNIATMPPSNCAFAHRSSSFSASSAARAFL